MMLYWYWHSQFNWVNTNLVNVTMDSSIGRDVENLYVCANLTALISIIWQGTCTVSQLQWNIQHVCVFYLEYGHLVPQLALLFGGKAELVDDFDSHIPPCLPVLSWWRDGALATDADVNWTSHDGHRLSYFIQLLLQNKRISLFLLLLVKTCCLHYPQCNFSADNLVRNSGALAETWFDIWHADITHLSV